MQTMSKRDNMQARRVLCIDLTRYEVRVEEVNLKDVKLLVGGRGFGIKYLLTKCPKGVDPYSPANPLIFATGVLAGTGALACSRWLVITKNALTGGYGRACAGGDFGAWMRFAGFDMIVVEGQAERPVYVHVSSQGVNFHSAEDLWGLQTHEVQEELRKRHGRKAKIACIGPAGERLVRFAAIVSGRRTAARCGVGAVMGSKKLKAVVINAESEAVKVHDPLRFRELVKRQRETIMSSKAFLKDKEYGTTDGVMWMNELAAFPVRNHRYGRLDGYDNLSPEQFKKLRIRNAGCYGCPTQCGKVHKVTSGEYAGAESEGPEYESAWAFSGPTENTDIAAIIAADMLCDRLGMDTISTGVTIGFAFELYEKGLIKPEDGDGMELVYGNHRAMIELIRKIALREGIGDLLAEGTLRAAQRIGRDAEYLAMQVKGLELSGYDPRARKITGFGYATNTIGGSHTNGALAMQEVGMPFPRPVDRFSEENVADIVIYNQNMAALRETGIVCAFAMAWGPWFRELYGQFLAKATGIDEFLDWDYLQKVGERIWNLDRLFNVREGMGRKDDTLPRRILTEPLRTKGGPGDGETIRRLESFLDDYYRLRGWDPEGRPTLRKLEALGVSEFVPDDIELQEEA